MYKITFVDNSTFTGGEIQDSKWNQMPDKAIKKLEYKVNKKTIVLENYEAYNHIVERILVLQRKQFISRLILMVKKGGDIMKIIFDFKKNKVSTDLAVFGKEYNGRSTSGWKQGFVGGKPKTYIV